MTASIPRPLSAAILVEAGRRTSDWVLASLGVSVATVSAGFAIYMIAVGPGAGPSRGTGDFGVFARYDRRPRLATAVEDPTPAAAQAVPLLPDATKVVGPQASAIDFMPVGSIAAQVGAQTGYALPDVPAARAKTQPVRMEEFVIRDVFDGKAVIEAHNKLHLVEPGSIIEDVGRVIAVRQEGHGWVVETEAGVIGR